MIDLKEPTKDEITRLAYALYLLRGCEPGSDVEDWVKAEKELSERQPQTARAAHDAAASHLRPVWFDKSSDRDCD